MLIKQIDVVILAGGLGKRLREVIHDIPKPMAEVQGNPFLKYILDKLANIGFKRIILSVGYRKDVIKSFFKNSYNNLDIIYSEEESPLGTGGALKKICNTINSNPFILLNGDSFIKIDFRNLLNYHIEKKAFITIVSTKIDDASNYGIVEITNDGEIISFQEKCKSNNKRINAGIYVIENEIFKYINEGFCSLERDIIPNLIGKKLFAFHSDGPFIDIGTKENYCKINNDPILLKELFS